MKLITTVVIAILGGLLGHKLRIPAGGILGAMMAVGVYNLLGKEAYLPANIGVAAQIMAGAIIGLRVNKATILGLKDMLIPSVIIVFGVLLTSLVIGFVISKFSDMSLATCLFASAPGGITEITLASGDFGADTAKVALLQSLRLVSVIAILPNALRVLLRFFSN